MAHCIKCDEKDETKFGRDNTRSSGLRSMCRACDNARTKEREARKQALMHKIRQKGCRACGHKDERVIEFHHIEKRLMTVPGAAHGYTGVQKFFNEVTKCVALCRNCHALTHKGALDIQTIPRYTEEELRAMY